ncbi:aminotransferase class V-fold PLP-dependent enzyme [Cnuibacter sp. UC19_7]|uniref:aminotransferase class V-fold PLP-dependent enzyme n=1 Tax=Cnuibacter sp. UC19_7 TaxID=3350166 RepID=UPI00366EE5BD
MEAETVGRKTVEQLRESFDVRPGYLAACTSGVPPRQSVAALRDDLDAWSAGTTTPLGYGAWAERGRAAYARLVGVDVSRVAIGSQTSVMVAMIASSLPAGAEVIVVDGDFSSMVFPFLVRDDLVVRHVPLPSLADAVGPDTALVAFSLVQSATGEIADADAIVAAARAAGARTLCDTTQATGWMRVDASRFDATVCHAYKWLCAPRGVALLTVSESFAAELVPTTAGWYAGDDVWGSCYGPTMSLAADARRFDVSPAWQAWVGATTSLELFASVAAEEVEAYTGGLGDSLRSRLGLPLTGSAIVTWPDETGTDAAALAAAGIVASSRAGRARVAFHVWNDESEVERVCAALGRGAVGELLVPADWAAEYGAYAI